MNILKQLEELVTQFQTNQFLKARIKLTLYQIFLVALILLLINLAVFFLFKENFQIQKESNIHKTILIIEGHDEDISDEYLAEEASELLFKALATADFLIILLSFFFSYFITKKILQPAENFLKQQEEFTAHAAHELRTPLAVMKSGAELYKNGDFAEKDYKKFISDQLDEINHMIKISNDLLLLIHNSKSKNNFDHCNLSKMLSEEVEKLEKYAKEKNIKIDKNIQNNINLKCSENEIKRAVKNLLKNAVDHNIKNGEIDIKLISNKKKIYLTISNTGIKIPKKDLPFIFDRFFKSQNSSMNDHNSTGLGLSIVKEIIEKHGGRIEVFSKENEKTRFHIQIPIR